MSSLWKSWRMSAVDVCRARVCVRSIGSVFGHQVVTESPAERVQYGCVSKEESTRVWERVHVHERHVQCRHRVRRIAVHDDVRSRGSMCFVGGDNKWMHT